MSAPLQVRDASRHRDLLQGGAVQQDVIVEGQGPAIVLLPSLGRDSEDYDDVAAGLAAQGFLVLRPQPRGLGASTGPMDGITLADYAHDVAHVINALGGGRAVIVGHAFGNWVARMTASVHAECVRGVVIAAAAAKQYPPHLTQAIRRIADPATSDEQRLKDLQDTFFAPGNDASVWLHGWHKTVRDSQFAAHLATPQALWWSAGVAPASTPCACGVPGRWKTCTWSASTPVTTWAPSPKWPAPKASPECFTRPTAPKRGRNCACARNISSFPPPCKTCCAVTRTCMARCSAWANTQQSHSTTPTRPSPWPS